VIGALLAAGAAGYGLERVWARRFHRPDPAAGHRLHLPDDVERHHLPTSDGGRSFVVSAGSGRPLVLLHGITMRADAWVYQYELADRAHVIAVDLRGHGRSIVGRDGATIGLCARDLRELLETLDLRDAVLVGHSLGGMALGQFLLDHPEVARERVGAFALLGTAGRMPVALPAPVLATLADRLLADAEGGGRLTARLHRLPRSDLGEWGVRQAFGKDPSRRHLDLVAASFEQLPGDVYISLLTSIIGFDALDAWARVEQPVAIAVGGRDRIVPPRESERLARTVPGARLERYPGAGHILMYERPREVNGILTALVEG
jgi:pimeloyl-ACP methyl ester carboxylesterase